jgi:GNAT superfamily N-acetyltransferase
MFGGLFGRSGPQLRPMGNQHLDVVLDIINETDEDDAAEAKDSFARNGIAGMFVLQNEGQVLGVTGAYEADDAEQVMWLSWTYLTGEARGEGLGRFMINELLGFLNKHGTRKIFIATSDYQDDGVDIYADARALYEAFGASEELRVPGYHSADETKIIFGLHNPGVQSSPADDMDAVDGIKFHDLFPAPESDGGFSVNWTAFGQGVVGLVDVIEEAKNEGVRSVFISLPQDISDFASDELKYTGFQQQGTLSDYYKCGLSQIWWTNTLGKI